MLSGMLHYWELMRVEIRPWIWGLLTTLYLAVIVPSQSLTLFLLAFISFQALKEYFSIIPIRQTERPLLLLGYLSVPLQFLCLTFNSFGPALAFIPIYIVVISVVGLYKYGKTLELLNSILKIGWGIFTLVYLFSYLGLLRQWPIQADVATSGIGLSLFFLFMVHFQSMTQFLLTRWRVNEWPRYVFNSHIGGIGGITSILATGVIAWSIGPWITWLRAPDALLVGLIVGSAAYIGTATVRTVQQALYINNEEHLIPGMGGILNLVYPFVYAAPMLFFLLMLLYR